MPITDDVPLPRGSAVIGEHNGYAIYRWTADDVRAYGDARAAAATERAANLAHNKALHCESHDNPYGQGAALDIEDAIRGS